jgi:hypothetical protein
VVEIQWKIPEARGCGDAGRSSAFSQLLRLSDAGPRRCSLERSGKTVRAFGLVAALAALPAALEWLIVSLQEPASGESWFMPGSSPDLRLKNFCTRPLH